MSPSNEQPCPLCNLAKHLVSSERSGGLLTRFDCRRCDSFLWAKYGCDDFKSKFYLISGYVKHYNQKDYEKYIQIDENSIPTILNEVESYGVKEKSDSLLLAIKRKSKYPGDWVHLDDEHDYPFAYAKDKSEFVFYRNHLIEAGFLKSKEIPNPVMITVAGWNALDAIEDSGPFSKDCFVAMRFDPKYDSYYTSVQNAVKNTNLGYAAKKLNDPQTNEIIDNALIVRMKACRFMIADLSANNHGVYFESGFVKGLKRPVIFTCKKLNKDKTLADLPAEKLHFDVEHHPVLFWAEDELDKFEEDLKNLIIAWGV